MTPVRFPEANQVIGPPAGMTEDQVRAIPVFIGQIADPKSNLDGATVFVVAWELSDAEIEKLKVSRRVFVGMLGGVPPHALSLDFNTCLP